MPKKLIIAHRGASAEAPENTLESFQKAIDAGADMIELDVHRTQDGILAVFHDSFIGFHPIKNLTYQQLKLAARVKGVEVPTLKESLELIRGKSAVQIELKGGGFGPQAAREALDILQPQDFYIISFFFRPLGFIKQVYPNVKTALIVGGFGGPLWGLRWYFLNNPQHLKYLDAIAIGYNLWKQNWTQKIPKEKQVFVWVVDNPGIFKEICADGRVVGIATNNPRLIIKSIKDGNPR